jgi:hypothetical protein
VKNLVWSHHLGSFQYNIISLAKISVNRIIMLSAQVKKVAPLLRLEAKSPGLLLFTPEQEVETEDGPLLEQVAEKGAALEQVAEEGAALEQVIV